MLPEYGTSYPAYVYNENADVIYPYVSAYETYLKDNGVESARATLISYEQVNDLKINKGNPSWLYSTSYWTGSADNVSDVWNVQSQGYANPSYVDGSDSVLCGVRPVITISTSEIQ